MGVPIGADRGPTRNKNSGGRSRTAVGRARSCSAKALRPHPVFYIDPDASVEFFRHAFRDRCVNTQLGRFALESIGRGTYAHKRRNRKFADSPLEGTGFETSVPRYPWWSRGSPTYAIRVERRVASEVVLLRSRRERIRPPADRPRVQASSLVCRSGRRILRESNGIEETGTASRSSP